MIKDLVNKALSVGLKPSDNEVKKRKIIFLNGVIYVTIGLLIGLIILEISEACYWALPLHAARIGGFLLALFFISRGRYNNSIYVIQYTILISSIIGTIIAPATNAFHFLVIPICAVSFYLTGGSIENIFFFIFNIIYFIAAYFYNLLYLPRELQISNVISISIVFTAFYVVLAVYVWEYKYMEKLITEKNQQLLDQNVKLTDQNKTLETQNTQLEASNTLKDNLFTIISHDLKGPFNNIYGFTEMLVSNFRTNDKEKNEKILELLNDSVSQTSFMLNDLLYWARCQTNRIEVNKEDTSISKLIDELLTIYNGFISSKNITIVNQKYQDDTIFIDRTLLSIIIRNLFANAIKYSPQNGAISFSIQKTFSSTKISISDSGNGMTPHKLSLIETSKIARSTPGTKNELGHGLGLVTCFELARKINAEIIFEEATGGGTIASVVVIT